MRFPLVQFRKIYPDDDTCLDKLFQSLRMELKVCRKCYVKTTFHRVRNRRCYECKRCGHQVYPTVGTIFENTRIQLFDWFYLMYLMDNYRELAHLKYIKRHLKANGYRCTSLMV